jgi:probable F420-dependent oxidoreductase
VRTNGFRLRVDAPNSTITMAAFGPRTVALAGEVADRMVLNLVTVDQAERLHGALAEAAAAAGRPTPSMACWITAAVDPTPAAREQLRRALVAYVAAPGYGEMFADAGFGAVVALARSGVHPRDVLAAVPDELVEAIGAIGSPTTVRKRLDEYRRAGVDHVALVPATAGDPGANRTLAELSEG